MLLPNICVRLAGNFLSAAALAPGALGRGVVLLHTSVPIFMVRAPWGELIFIVISMRQCGALIPRRFSKPSFFTATVISVGPICRVKPAGILGAPLETA